MSTSKVTKTITTVTSYEVTLGEIEALIRHHLVGPVQAKLEFQWYDNVGDSDSVETVLVVRNSVTEYQDD